MLKFNLYPIFRIRNVSNPRRFLIARGMNHISASKLLKGEQSSLRLKHVERICRALHCTPNDLLEWSPDANEVLDQAHPLRLLAPRKKVGALLNKLESLSIEEIERLLEK